MNISILIKKLEEIKQQYGDLEILVYGDNPDNISNEIKLTPLTGNETSYDEESYYEFYFNLCDLANKECNDCKSCDKAPEFKPEYLMIDDNF